MGVRELSPELAEKAIKELNEDPGRLQDDISHIKEWIAKQPHLRARTDDQWILSFLRGCKFSLEKTKSKIDMYYTTSAAAPELTDISNPNDQILLDILSAGSTVPLIKSSCSTEPRVIIIRPGATDPSKHHVSDTVRLSRMINAIQLMADDQAVISGVCYILDLSNATMAHVTQMTPSLMKKMVILGQETSPLRQKGTHYINSPPGFETIFNLFKSFMNEKNRSRLYVHNDDMESLYKIIPKETLPKEYGGDAGTIEEILDHWRKKIAEYSEFFKDEANYGTDEKKRIGSPKTSESLFGIEGSFRQLSVD